MSFVTSLTRGLLSILYPPLCLGCGSRVDSPHRPLCADCTNRHAPVRSEHIASILERLPIKDHGIDAGFALWTFEKDTALQDVLHLLKYGNRPRFGVVLGRMLGRKYLGALTETGMECTDFLLPIPLARSRYLTRGYNQSSYLARGMSDILHIPVHRNLLRRRPTRSQTNLNRNERWKNVAAAFYVETDESVLGQTILLIDDVLTTGSTVSAAARTLKSAGASSIHVATLAVARLYEKDRSSRV